MNGTLIAHLEPSHNSYINNNKIRFNVVAAMNNGYPSVSIEDIARLAGETCVYRGASQGNKTPAATAQRESTSLPGRLLKLLTPRRR